MKNGQDHKKWAGQVGWKYKNPERKVITEATFALRTLTKNNTEQTQINNVKKKGGGASVRMLQTSKRRGHG